MGWRRSRDRPRWVQVGVCRVRIGLYPAPVVEVRNPSGRELSDADKNAVTRWVIGELQEAGYACDGLAVRDRVWGR